MAIGSCCNVIEEKGCELCCVNYTRVPSSNTRSPMLLLLICRGAFLIMLEMAMAMTRKMLLGFWRPMGILNPNSKGKNELYSHRICYFLLVLG
ncbi:hypothetical protein V6Z11_A04G120600 [Gossypium hirsutum]